MTHMQEAEALIEKISERAAEILELQDLEPQDLEDEGAFAMRTRLARLKAEQENDRDALSAHAVLAIAEESRRAAERGTFHREPVIGADLAADGGTVIAQAYPGGTGLRSQQPIKVKRLKGQFPSLSDEDAQELAGAVYTMVQERGGVAGAARLIQHVFDGGSPDDLIVDTPLRDIVTRWMAHSEQPQEAAVEAHKLINPGSTTTTVYGPVPLPQSVKVIQKVACPRCGAIADIPCQDDLRPQRTLPVGHYHQERVEAAGYVLRAGRIERVDESPMRDMVDHMIENAPKPPYVRYIEQNHPELLVDPLAEPTAKDGAKCDDISKDHLMTASVDHMVAHHGAKPSSEPQEAAEEPDEPSDVYPVTEAVKSDVADAMQAALYWALKPETPRGFNPDASQQARFLAGVLVAKGFDHPSYGRTEREKAANVTALRQRIGRILQAPRDGVRIERYVLSDLSNALAKFLTAEGWMKVTGRQEPTVVDEAALAALLEADLREVIKQPKPETTVEKIAQRAAARLVQKGWTKP